MMHLSSSSSSSSISSEEENFLGLIVQEMLKTRHKNEDFAEETVLKYSDQEFHEHFRISRQLCTSLAVQFEQSDLYPKSDTGHTRIPAEKCILIFLWYAAHEAASFRDVADRFNISLDTLHRIILNVSLFLSDLSSTIIKWPSEDEKTEILQDFEDMGFPDVLGCIDGSHIRVDTPSEDAESYLNRKKFHSIQIQAVCDSRRKIRDVFIGYPGSVHDGRVFRNSPLFNDLATKCGDKLILADSAYPCLRNVMTPYRDMGNLTNVEKKFNKRLSHCRVLIEHTFGILKQKFRQLYHLKLRSLSTICHFIRACCVLHNLSIDDDFNNQLDFKNDTPPADLLEVEENDENEGTPAGRNYRNYIASVLYHLN